MVLLEASIQLVPDGTLLVHLLMVAVMVFILNRTLLRPVNQILAEREKQIAGRLREAEALAAETEQKLKKYNDALHDARVEGYKLLEKERAEALKEKDEKVRQHREQTSTEVAAQLDNLKRQEQSVKQELETQAASISNLISAQVLRRRT
ncbi:MAG TPA: ATP synthase F0 subunit B [Pyrinomonadaceae bacterium]|jgi:F0F1-type ATP synthase membrane subunit b/b'|nr:ATP synthase F0 subunit B [Pyrinomonadaceae bacterium]